MLLIKEQLVSHLQKLLPPDPRPADVTPMEQRHNSRDLSQLSCCLTSVLKCKSRKSSPDHLPASGLDFACRVCKLLSYSTLSLIHSLLTKGPFRFLSPVPITLDPDCKHPDLKLSEDKKRVWQGPASPELDAASGALLVVGKEGFMAGRQYWEVEVGKKLDWELGVLSQSERDRVKREKAEKLLEEGYWSLKRFQGDFFSSIKNDKIEKRDMPYEVIGVFLDQENGRVSFYDAGRMFLITTIPAEFTNKILYYPFLSSRNNRGDSFIKTLYKSASAPESLM
uniref:B30.2/SPRY domain-containing protein n=1 Tax=Gopherus evgoodei TaxID=1825980 RepID=A0A8C4YFS3_9SAUR